MLRPGPRRLQQGRCSRHSFTRSDLDDQASAYCVYDSKNGKVELDIFYPAADSAEGAKGTEKTVLAEVGGKFEPVSLPGADSATINLAVPGKIPSASICVRKNVAVFTLNIPQSPQSREQLLALSQLISYPFKGKITPRII